MSVRRPVALWICGLLALTVLCVYVTIRFPFVQSGGDAQAFWCATRTVLHHENPYTNEPLYDCELALSPSVTKIYHGAPLPSPIPPYAFWFIAPFSVLPFQAFFVVWTLMLVGATALCVLGVIRCTGLAPPIAWAVIPLAVYAPASLWGSLAPIPIACLVWGAFFLQRGRWWASVACLGCAMVQPTLALPACCAVVAFVSAVRWRFVAVGILAGCGALLAVGFSGIVYYLTQELPAQALAEAHGSIQESLTTVLTHLGMANGPALHLASAQYVGMIVLGIFLAGRLAHRTQDRTILTLLPAGFAAIGGSYIHLTEVAMLVPLACWLVARFPSALSWFALLVVAFPLGQIVDWPLLVIPVCCAMSIIVTYAPWFQRLVAWKALSVVVGLCAALISGIGVLRFAPFMPVVPFTPQSMRVHAVPGSATSSAMWGEAVTRMYSQVSWFWWVEHLWLLSAMIVLIVLCVRYAGCFERAFSRPLALSFRQKQADL